MLKLTLYYISSKRKQYEHVESWLDLGYLENVKVVNICIL